MGDAKYMTSGFRAMTQSDVMGGTVRFGNSAKEYDCTIGTFTKQDSFERGVSPGLMGEVQVAREDFDPEKQFALGEQLTVTPAAGPERVCRILSAQHSGPLINLLLRDINESA